MKKERRRDIIAMEKNKISLTVSRLKAMALILVLVMTVFFTALAMILFFSLVEFPFYYGVFCTEKLLASICFVDCFVGFMVFIWAFDRYLRWIFRKLAGPAGTVLCLWSEDKQHSEAWFRAKTKVRVAQICKKQIL